MSDSTFSILVVDDSEDYRSLLCLFLRQLPCTIHEARDGEEAVEMFAETSFDLILMDVIMPLMDGVDAISEIRKIEDGSNGHVPIVALSGEDSQETGEDCLKAGADRMLLKPVPKDVLLGTIKEMLGG